MIRLLSAVAAMMVIATAAHGQTLDPGLLQAPVDGSVASWIIRTFGLLTVLSVAPGILIMVTSFPRFIIAFAILRAGMGLATTPANMILVSLALFMTFYVMAPTFDRAWENGVTPLLEDQITEEEAIQLIADPFRDFMLVNTRPKDLACLSTSPPSVGRAPKLMARSTCGFWCRPS
jgi:flagellar biosynthetic protein FliP